MGGWIKMECFNANSAGRLEMERDCEIPQSITSIIGESTQLFQRVWDADSVPSSTDPPTKQSK